LGEIATFYNCSEATISNRLKELGVIAREARKPIIDAEQFKTDHSMLTLARMSAKYSLCEQTIISYAQGFGLPRKKTISKQYGQISLPITEMSVIVGSLLGDACLTKPNRESFYIEGHCLAQEKYLRWKIELLGWNIIPRPDKLSPITDHVICRDAYREIMDQIGKRHPGYDIRTAAHPLFTAMVNQWYLRDEMVPTSLNKLVSGNFESRDSQKI
jgi:hypothetical protein